MLPSDTARDDDFDDGYGSRHAGAVLTVDLDAVASNWRLLADRVAPHAHCAGVVKADAYGLGLRRVGPALAAAGCRHFFTAHLDEALALRRLLPDVEIGVLCGSIAGAEWEYVTHRLIPTLNHLGDLEHWRRFSRDEVRAPAAIHLDTGMGRLGLSFAEVERLAAEPQRAEGIEFAYVMSHLACADEPDHPLNARQLSALRDALAVLPVQAPVSFANSSGVFLDPTFHFDLARPGVAIYGANPTPAAPNPMRPVVRLQGRIVQVRDVDRPTTVGYGATREIAGPAKLATVSVGYADGYLRSLSNRGTARLGGRRVPLVGRVSMDLIVVDVSTVPEAEARPGAFIDLLDADHTVDDLATEAGTIAYEILTGLGHRYRRRYLGGV